MSVHRRNADWRQRTATVRMVNINYGHSERILSSCEPLKEYAWLIDRIRNIVDNGMELEMSADKALNDMPDSFELKNRQSSAVHTVMFVL